MTNENGRKNKEKQSHTDRFADSRRIPPPISIPGARTSRELNQSMPHR
jgi:hypothetical protein